MITDASNHGPKLFDGNSDSEDRQLYSPAMLAELLNVSVRTIRRWQRAGLIEPVSEVMHLPQFDFSGLATAKQLAEWTHAGATVASIQQQLEAHRARVGSDAPIEDLPITASGRNLVLRHGDQFFEASGQLRFGFEGPKIFEAEELPATICFEEASKQSAKHKSASVQDESLESIIENAITAEDDGDYETAIQWYRCAITNFGLDADVCFQIAELLYRVGDIQGARERYFVALEIDPDLVEARANLGCVLVECNQPELAIAAFEGALEQFPDYADVHFHLARALDATSESGRAAIHWQRFLDLAPSSPWAEEAQQRLREHMPLQY
ncbi:MAG: tetratricopeptide repeat protein [Aureliella sp.]